MSVLLHLFFYKIAGAASPDLLLSQNKNQELSRIIEEKENANQTMRKKNSWKKQQVGFASNDSSAIYNKEIEKTERTKRNLVQ